MTNSSNYNKRDVSESEASHLLAAVAAVLVGVLIAVLIVVLVGILVGILVVVLVLGSVLIAVLILVIHDVSSIIFPAVRPLFQYARIFMIYPLL